MVPTGGGFLKRIVSLCPPAIGLTRFPVVFTVPFGPRCVSSLSGEGFAVLGTLGFQELIIILVIVLIIFGAGRLPQIGEGVGKALKGFKKEVNESPPPPDGNDGQNGVPPSPAEPASPPVATASAPAPQPVGQHPARPGTEMTPGTLAASVYGGFGPETVQPAQPGASTPVPGDQGKQAPATPYQEPFQPVTMEQRAASTVPHQLTQYPPVPPAAASAVPGKRPAAIVNKQAVARVQARRAAMQQAKAAQARPATPGQGGKDDLQSLGEGLGGAVRTFREATADIRNAVDPEMRTIQAELESAHKEVEQSIESAKHPPAPRDQPPVP